MISIKTKRLTINNFTSVDWQGLKEIIISYEQSPYAIYDHQWPTTDKQLQNICAWFAKANEFLAVRLNETLIGYISLNKTEEQGVYNIGYNFNSKYHKKGYAIESCRAIINFAFNNLKALKLMTGTAEKNGPSNNLLKQLGFISVGENICSFRNDTSGKAIEFNAINYELKNISK